MIQEMISIIFITAADGRHDNGVHDMFVSSRVSVCSKNVLFDLSALSRLNCAEDCFRLFVADVRRDVLPGLAVVLVAAW